MRRPALAALLLVAAAFVLAPSVAACPNDPDLFQFSNTAFGATEGEGAAVVTVVRAGASGCASSVAYETVASGGSAQPDVDFLTTSGTLDFAEGQTSAMFEVPIVNDLDEESDETFVVILSFTTTQADLGSPVDATVTIVDDDAQSACETQGQTFRFASSTLAVGESDGIASLVVERIGGADCLATAGYSFAESAATAGADYTGAPGFLAFGAGETSLAIDVAILSDGEDETDESFTVTLDYVESTNAQVGAPSTATVTIVDDDTASVPCAPQTVRFASTTHEVGESAGPVSVSILREGSLACTVTLSLVVSGASATSGTDFHAVGDQRVTIGAGGASAAASLTIVQDALDEPNESVAIALSIVAGQNASVTGPTIATLWIVDDDLPPLTGPGRIALSPASLTFAPKKAGGNASTPLRFNVTNEGASELGPLTLAAPAGFEANTYLCPDALAPAASCVVEVRFNPTERGILAGNVTVGAPGIANASGAVVGRAWAPGDLELSPTRIDVGTMYVGRGSIFFNVTVTNRAAFESGALAPVGDFHALGDWSCGPSLAPGASCYYHMFNTGVDTLGPYRANFTVRSENLGVATIPFHAVVQPLPKDVLRVTPATLDFGEQPRDIQVIRAFTLTNTGPLSLRLGTPRITGDWSPVGMTTDCSPTLGPGESCPYSVRLLARELGPRNGTLIVGSDWGDSNIANLTATAYDPSLVPNVCLKPAKEPKPCASELRFNDTNVGSTSAEAVLVVNSGPGEAKLYAWELPGGAFAVSNDCESTLAAPATGAKTACRLLLTFKPTGGTTERGTLRVFTNAAGWKELFVTGVGLADVTTPIKVTGPDLIVPDAKTPAPSTLLVLVGLAAAALAATRRVKARP